MVPGFEAKYLGNYSGRPPCLANPAIYPLNQHLNTALASFFELLFICRPAAIILYSVQSKFIKIYILLYDTVKSINIRKLSLLH